MSGKLSFNLGKETVEYCWCQGVVSHPNFQILGHLLRHFWLPLVKNRVVIGCGRIYEPLFHVGTRTTRNKFAPLAPRLGENSHWFAPAGHLLAPTRYCWKCYNLQSRLRDCCIQMGSHLSHHQNTEGTTILTPDHHFCYSYPIWL